MYVYSLQKIIKQKQITARGFNTKKNNSNREFFRTMPFNKELKLLGLLLVLGFGF